MKPVHRVPRRRSATAATMLVAAILTCGLAAADDEITQGSLRYTDPDSGSPVEFPLEHTDVDIAVSGTVAQVTVRQRFSNPLDSRLEAVYVFPLPDRAAVDAMTIVVGDRRVEGEIQRREEARRTYDEARRAGHLAGLLDQERPNIFTQRLANILPAETVEVEIHYVEDLHFDHGVWRLVFPTVVGPRYIPGAPTGRTGSGWSPDTDQVPDASRITPTVLKPGQRSGHDIAISVTLDPGFAIRDLASPSHEVRVNRSGRDRATIALAPLDTIPNKDFVLNWITGGAAVESTVIAHRTAGDGYLTLILQPPSQPAADRIVPREVVFVLDTSGSMSGEPIAACKQLVRKALKALRPDDTFRLIRFAGRADQLSPDALPVSRTNLERALSYLDGMRGGGGTEMLAGVRAAIEAPTDPYRLRMVLFLTDGYIGNEEAIIRGVTEKLGDTRIFSLGVGSSVNRYLLDRLATAGRGVAEYLRPGESPDALVDRFYDRFTDPVFTELELDWGGLEIVDVEPEGLPDLFAAQPLLVHARYRSGGRGTVTLRGWAGTERVEVSTRIRLPDREPANAAQASLWARAHIARLEMDKVVGGDPQPIVDRITELALEHRLMTAYTSFVAVDHSEVRDGGELTTIDQPLPMPEGVSYEGVFGGEREIQNLRSINGMAAPKQKRVALPETFVRTQPARALGDGSGAERGSYGSVAFVPDSNLVLGMPDTPPPPEPGGPVRYVVGGSVTEPVKLTGRDPRYPEAARHARVQGVVVLEVTIDAGGSVTDVQALRQLPLGATDAAIEAVRGWSFTPALLNDRPVAVKYIVTVRFTLGGTAVTGINTARSIQHPVAAETTQRGAEAVQEQEPEVRVPDATEGRAADRERPAVDPAGHVVSDDSRSGADEGILLPTFSIAILVPSLLLLIFASGTRLARRRIAAS